MFFRAVDTRDLPITALAEEEFHNRNLNKRVEIAGWVDNLSADAREDFRDYVRQDPLA